MKTNLLLAMVLAGCWAALPANAYPTYSASVEIRSVSDFYEPLATTGHWVEINRYGWCWYPATLDRNWRPYGSGNWVWCDQGWYWDSDEPWAWATYHYGGWVWDAYYGWVWVPDVVWSPARVCWREGGGYIGWAPQPPVTEVVVVAPQYFVFVEQQHFCHPVRPANLIVNQTVINQTANITKFGQGSQVVYHPGPIARNNPDRVVSAPVNRPAPPVVQPSRPEWHNAGWAQRPGPPVVQQTRSNPDANAGASPTPAAPIVSEPGRKLRHHLRDDNLGTLTAQGR